MRPDPPASPASAPYGPPRPGYTAAPGFDLLRGADNKGWDEELPELPPDGALQLRELIEAEATTKIGAEWGEHTDTRTTRRNGHREKTVTTQAGDLELAIPRLRAGSFFPGLPGALAADRPGPLRGDRGGIGPRCVHPVGRRPGRSPRLRHRDVQERGVPDLRGPGRTVGRVPDTSAGPHPVRGPADEPVRRPGLAQSSWGALFDASSVPDRRGSFSSSARSASSGGPLLHATGGVGAVIVWGSSEPGRTLGCDPGAWDLCVSSLGFVMEYVFPPLSHRCPRCPAPADAP